MRSKGIKLAAGLALLFVGTSVEAQTATTSISTDGKTLTLSATDNGTHGFKDLHFGAGALPAGTALTLTDNQGLNWTINVASGEVNLFGAAQMPANMKTTFTITIPAAANFKFTSVGTKTDLKFTTDGDQNSAPAVSTLTNKVPPIVAIPTNAPLPPWAMGAILALVLGAGLVILRRNAA